MSELKIWMNGSLKSQEEAVLPVNSAAVFYGTNVFEGIRAYWKSSSASASRSTSRASTSP
jgi:branched-chain amino acid aminotransferase